MTKFIAFLLVLASTSLAAKNRKARGSKRVCPGKSHLELTQEQYSVVDLGVQKEQYHIRDSRSCQQKCQYDYTCQIATWVPQYSRCFIKNYRTHQCAGRKYQGFAPLTVSRAYVWTRICDCLPVRQVGRHGKRNKYGLSHYQVSLNQEVTFYKCRKHRGHGYHCNRDIDHERTNTYSNPHAAPKSSYSTYPAPKSSYSKPEYFPQAKPQYVPETKPEYIPQVLPQQPSYIEDVPYSVNEEQDYSPVDYVQSISSPGYPPQSSDQQYIGN